MDTLNTLKDNLSGQVGNITNLISSNVGEIQNLAKNAIASGGSIFNSMFNWGNGEGAPRTRNST